MQSYVQKKNDSKFMGYRKEERRIRFRPKSVEGGITGEVPGGYNIAQFGKGRSSYIERISVDAP